MSTNHLHVTLHSSFFTVFIVFLQILAACAALSATERLGDIALCPFDVTVNEDPSRIPKDIKQHTCRSTKGMKTMDGDDKESTLTCEDVGGHCVQVHETIKVSYRHRAINHRKHEVRVNMSCICVPLRSKPATPILPPIDR